MDSQVHKALACVYIYTHTAKCTKLLRCRPYPCFLGGCFQRGEPMTHKSQRCAWSLKYCISCGDLKTININFRRGLA